MFQAKRVKSSRAAADSASPPAMNRGQGTARLHWPPGPTPVSTIPVTRDEGLFQVVLGGSSAALFPGCLTRRLTSSRSLPHTLSLSSTPLVLFLIFFINPVSFCFSVWSLSRPVSSSLSVLGRPTSWCQDVLTSVCCRCHCGRLKRWSTIFFWVVDNRWHSIYWILGFVCVCIRGGG